MMLILLLPQIGFSIYFSYGEYESIRPEQTMLSSFAVGNTSSIVIPYLGKSIDKEAIGVGISTMDLAAILFFTFFVRSLKKKRLKRKLKLLINWRLQLLTILLEYKTSPKT